jgi:hypothetical protein
VFVGTDPFLLAVVKPLKDREFADMPVAAGADEPERTEIYVVVFASSGVLVFREF